MTGSGQLYESLWPKIAKCAFLTQFWLLAACNRPAAEKALELGDAARGPTASAVPPASEPVRTVSSAVTPAPVEKIDFQDVAMGTSVHIIAYTGAQVDSALARSAISQALGEMKRLEALLSEWRDDSEVGRASCRERVSRYV